jgi:signal transduction histidine kinase
MAPWNSTKLQLIGFLVISIFMIVFVILSGITYLVNQIYLADQRRLLILHEAEYANKMASLGRLSAGVAHEINNPLAIINEKAGLIKDLLTYNPEAAKGPKLKPLLDTVIASVERCARITRRLLNFARQSEMKMISLDLKTVIQDVLSFTGKEAEYRRIDVRVEIPEDIPAISSDQGRLQEIFLNLITNAFAAVQDGGSLEITAAAEPERVAVRFTDNGHGIPKKDLERIFDPFFSTKTASGGTGLGLSITYGLVQELGGTIHVESQVGTGTTFEVRLPCCAETDIHHQPSESKGKEHHENPAG